MKYRITHTTSYSYSAPVSLCHNLAHLKPLSFGRQSCISSNITVDPLPATIHDWQDSFGNHSTYFAVQQPHSSLTVTAVSEVLVTSQSDLLDSAFPTTWETAREHLLTSADTDTLTARPYVLESPFVTFTPELTEYAAHSFTPGRPLLDVVHELMQRIFNEFDYDPHFSTIATPLNDVLAHKKGVCQDFAHLAIACLRSHGLAARYVSGYIETLPPPGEEKLAGADASHAWFSVYVPYLGWMDFDPTNNQVPINQHVVTAWGRDYSDVTPLKGVVFGGGNHSLDVSVDMARLGEVND